MKTMPLTNQEIFSNIEDALRTLTNQEIFSNIEDALRTLTKQETLANLEEVLITLTNLEEALIKALGLSKVSGNHADFKALREAENAYMSFVETHNKVIEGLAREATIPSVHY